MENVLLVQTKNDTIRIISQSLNNVFHLAFGLDTALLSNIVSRKAMIRTKKITYLESAAIAIYFQNMTQQVKQLRLESQILQEKNRTQQLESYTSTISHEFRTPLGTSLMFLE